MGRLKGPQTARLGWAIRTLRAERGLSQEALGNAAGLHRNYVGSLERGELSPTFRVLLKIAVGLGVPLSTIVVRYEVAPDCGDEAG